MAITPILLNALDTAYTQNFDTLSNTAASTTNTLAITGWALTETGGGARDNEQYAVDTGSSTTGDMFSYGSAASTDRALGALRSGTLIPVFGAFFSNSTGSTITSLDIAYSGEQWRLGTAARTDRIDFQYSLDATDLTTGTWLDLNTLDFSTPDTATTGAKNGNVAKTALSSTITGLSLANGATFAVRWTDLDATGADDGLAVDDFSLTPHTAAATPSLSISDASVTEGNSGTTVLTYTVTSNMAAPAGGITFDIATADGTATAGTDYVASALTSQTIAAGNTTYTFSITVNGDVAAEPSETVLVNLSNPTNATITDGQGVGTINNDDFVLTAIYTIQGAGHLSALDGQVVTTRGIVTARFSNGFHIQDATGDGNVNTSDGIFVFTGSSPAVNIGDDVTVGGTVKEFQGTGRTTDLTLTEIITPTVTVNSSGNTLPTAVVLGDGTNGTRLPPLVSLGDSDSSGTFNPATQGTDFYESLEGMLVTIQNAVTTSAFRSNFGEIVVRYDVGTNASINSRGGLTISDTTPDVAQPADKIFDFNPERLQIDDRAGGTTPVLTAVGEQLGNITGVLSYEFGAYDLNPTQNVSIVTASTLARETTTIVENFDRVRVASFNVENLAPVGQPVDGVATPASKYAGLAAAIVNNLKAPEIIALQEVLDNDGATNSSVTSASTTLADLIQAIVAAGGPLYTAIDSQPVDDTVGGIPGGNQRVAYLFNAEAVTPTARNGLITIAGTPNGVTILEAATSGQIGQGNTDFNATRKSLPMEWSPTGYTDANGGTFYTINNHLSSKGGSEPLYGNLLNLPLYADPLNGSAQSTAGSNEREGQAEAVNSYIDDILANALTTDDRVVALGDFNDFQFFPVIDLITGQLVRTVANPDGTASVFVAGTAVMAELADKLPVAERYSYSFDGNSQELDQILVSIGLFDSTEFDIVHINSEFATQISDHDPSVASIFLSRSAAIATSGNDVFDQSAYTAKFGATRGSLAGNDVIDGLDGNDTINAGKGNDRINGGNGTDTAVFSGNRADYSVVTNGGVLTITDNRGVNGDGVDTVSFVESFSFADVTVSAAQLVNIAPVAQVGSTSTSEDQSVNGQVVAVDSDQLPAPLTYSLVSTAQHGQLSFLANGSFTYTPTQNYNGVDSFTFVANDGDQASNTAQFTLTVQAINDAPAFNNLGGTVNYTENASAVVLDANVTAFDAELSSLASGGGDFGGAVLGISRAGGANASDIFTGSGNLSLGAGFVTLGGSNVGNVSNIGGMLTISLGNGVTQAQVNEILQSIAYSNNGQTFGGTISLNWSLGDGNVSAQGSGGALSASGSLTVSLISSSSTGATGTTGNDTLITGSGNDTLNGGAGNDTMTGGDGNDIYVVDSAGDVVNEGSGAGSGIDTVQTTLKTYTLADNVENLVYTGIGFIVATGNAGDNIITGGPQNNQLNGGDGNDTLIGGRGLDNLSGGTGNDKLYGGLGSDVLTGGTGTDSFYFDSAIGPSNVDYITDFVVRDDTMYLSQAIFGAAGPTGQLSAAAFKAGAAATTAAQRIIWNPENGQISYDADGSGSGAAVRFVTLLGQTNVLTAADFWIY